MEVADSYGPLDFFQHEWTGVQMQSDCVEGISLGPLLRGCWCISSTLSPEERGARVPGGLAEWERLRACLVPLCSELPMAVQPDALFARMAFCWESLIKAHQEKANLVRVTIGSGVSVELQAVCQGSVLFLVDTAVTACRAHGSSNPRIVSAATGPELKACTRNWRPVLDKWVSFLRSLTLLGVQVDEAAAAAAESAFGDTRSFPDIPERSICFPFSVNDKFVPPSPRRGAKALLDWALQRLESVRAEIHHDAETAVKASCHVESRGKCQLAMASIDPEEIGREAMKEATAATDSATATATTTTAEGGLERGARTPEPLDLTEVDSKRWHVLRSGFHVMLCAAAVARQKKLAALHVLMDSHYGEQGGTTREKGQEQEEEEEEEGDYSVLESRKSWQHRQEQQEQEQHQQVELFGAPAGSLRDFDTWTDDDSEQSPTSPSRAPLLPQKKKQSRIGIQGQAHLQGSVSGANRTNNNNTSNNERSNNREEMNGDDDEEVGNPWGRIGDHEDSSEEEDVEEEEEEEDGESDATSGSGFVFTHIESTLSSQHIPTVEHAQADRQVAGQPVDRLGTSNVSHVPESGLVVQPRVHVSVKLHHHHHHKHPDRHHHRRHHRRASVPFPHETDETEETDTQGTSGHTAVGPSDHLTESTSLQTL
jgi:hypothetical protein